MLQLNHTGQQWTLIPRISELGTVLARSMKSIRCTTMPLTILRMRRCRNLKTPECGTLWGIAMRRWTEGKRLLSVMNVPKDSRIKKVSHYTNLLNSSYKWAKHTRLQLALLRTSSARIMNKWNAQRSKMLSCI